MEIRFSKSAARAMLGADKRELIRRKIQDLASDPDAVRANVKKLRGRSESRLRVQDWRVIFRIEQGVLWIDEIGPRGSIY